MPPPPTAPCLDQCVNMATINESTGSSDSTAQAAADDAFRREAEAAGANVSQWDNGSGDHYGVHVHTYRKVLHCAESSIVFHLPEADVELVAGSSMEIAPGTPHSADVGTAGIRCIEAHFS